jgi:hypothetical protein
MMVGRMLRKWCSKHEKKSKFSTNNFRMILQYLHSIILANALVANRMNLQSCGKQPKMRSIFWTRKIPTKEQQIAQSMVFCEGNMDFNPK